MKPSDPYFDHLRGPFLGQYELDNMVRPLEICYTEIVDQIKQELLELAANHSFRELRLIHRKTAKWKFNLIALQL
jgi:hypothetical protein